MGILNFLVMHLSTLTIRKAEIIFMMNIKEAEFY
jgi:hypothetical protein